MPESNLEALASMKSVTRRVGGFEIATEPDLTRSVKFISIGEWLNHIESNRLSQTSIADVARIDASSGYIQELRGKSQEARQHNAIVSTHDVENFSGKYKDAVERGIKQSTNLVDDLTAIPNADETNQLAASIVKARVLNEVHRVMQTPDKSGNLPSFDEALTQVEAGMSGSRQRVIENAICDSVRIIRSPEAFYQGEASTLEEFFNETRAFEQQARFSLGQLEILRHANYYTQAGNKAERVRAITQAINSVADPNIQTVYGRQERLQALIDYSKNYGLLTKDQLAEQLKRYPQIQVQERALITERPAVATTITIVKVEDGGLQENTPGVCSTEDVEKLKQKMVDKDHVHWHARALFIPDTHGSNRQAIQSSIKQAYGTDVDVEFRDGKVFAGGEEVILYQGGDFIDPNKELMRWSEIYAGGITSHNEYLKAIKDPTHPKHSKAINLRNFFDKNSGEYEKSQEQWERLGNIRVSESVDYWQDGLRDGRVLWGNHEAMMVAGAIGNDEALLDWIMDTNQGSATLFELTGFSRESDLGFVGFDESVISHLDTQKKAEVCQKVREALRNSPTSKDLINNLMANVKLYNIVNGELIIHAGIPVDINTGKLISPESSQSLKKFYLQIPSREGYPSEALYQSAVDLQKKAQEFYSKIDTFTGLDALDYLENEIKARNPYAIIFVARGDDKMSPLWERKPFQEAMQQHGDVVISELSKQAEKKGVVGGIKRIIVGHTPAIGGTQVGERLLGADDNNHSAVRLELSKDSSGAISSEVRAKHNFGSSQLIADTVL